LRSELAATLKTVSDIMPGAGSYFNEVCTHSNMHLFGYIDKGVQGSAFELNPKETYFGSHYNRLKVIKDIYDPLGLFIVTVGVGSEDWDQELNCHL